MTTSIQLFRAYYTGDGLQAELHIDKLLPARGTETRPQKRWQDPHSSLAVMSVSPKASLLRAARGGDDRAREFLVAQIAEEAYQHAWFNKDRVCVERGKPFVKRLVNIALYDYIHNEPLSERAAASLLNITRTPYKKNWMPRVDAIADQWCRPLADELKNG